MPFLTPDARGEVEVIKTFLLQQLSQMRSTIVELSDEQARSIPTASGLSLVSLVEHTSAVAVHWVACAMQRTNNPDIPGSSDGAFFPLEKMVERANSLEVALENFDHNVKFVHAGLGAIQDLDADVPVPEGPWMPQELKTWQVRWVLLHACTEIARHVGQADIIREAIDGKTAYELNDIADRRC